MTFSREGTDLTNDEIWERAVTLACRPYQEIIFLDSTEDEPVFMALIPELSGCMTHGDTVEEARELIREVKAEFIYFLLEDGLPVPEPRLLGSYTCVDMSDFLALENETAPVSSWQFAG